MREKKPLHDKYKVAVRVSHERTTDFPPKRFDPINSYVIVRQPIAISARFCKHIWADCRISTMQVICTSVRHSRIDNRTHLIRLV